MITTQILLSEPDPERRNQRSTACEISTVAANSGTPNEQGVVSIGSYPQINWRAWGVSPMISG